MAYNIKSQKTGFRLLPGKHVFGKITGGGSNGFRSLFWVKKIKQRQNLDTKFNKVSWWILS